MEYVGANKGLLILGCDPDTSLRLTDLLEKSGRKSGISYLDARQWSYQFGIELLMLRRMSVTAYLYFGALDMEPNSDEYSLWAV